MKRAKLIEMLQNIRIEYGKITNDSCELIADFVQGEIEAARDRDCVRKNKQKKLDNKT